MAQCPFQKLKDLKLVLDQVRAWDGILEPKPGIFYFKRKPFLHFHEKEGRRWADAKSGAEWGPEIEIPFEASAKERQRFLATIQKRYRETCLKNERPPSTHL